jgi:hypothetical protein
MAALGHRPFVASTDHSVPWGKHTKICETHIVSVGKSSTFMVGFAHLCQFTRGYIGFAAGLSLQTSSTCPTIIHIHNQRCWLSVSHYLYMCIYNVCWLPIDGHLIAGGFCKFFMNPNITGLFHLISHTIHLMQLECTCK